jgi:hypothetical protein
MHPAKREQNGLGLEFSVGGIALPKKILSTPESDTMIASLRKINNQIRNARASKLQVWVRGILRCDPDNLTNIYSHIHTILLAFIKRKQHVNSEEYFYLIKCGNAILNTEYITNPNKSQYVQYKYMMALYFLNYIKMLTTHDFRNKYVCNINEYVRTCYNNILVNAGQQNNANIEMRHIYMNLKKIAYVKQYPYAIDSKIFSKIFSIMLDYWQDADYNITEIPASYIIKDRILSYDELSNLAVSQHEMNLLFGAYFANGKGNNIVIEINNDEHAINGINDINGCNDINDINDTFVEEPDVSDVNPNIIQNDENDAQEENDEYVYPDDYD